MRGRDVLGAADRVAPPRGRAELHYVEAVCVDEAVRAHEHHDREPKHDAPDDQLCAEQRLDEPHRARRLVPGGSGDRAGKAASLCWFRSSPPGGSGTDAAARVRRSGERSRE